MGEMSDVAHLLVDLCICQWIQLVDWLVASAPMADSVAALAADSLMDLVVHLPFVWREVMMILNTFSGR